MLPASTRIFVCTESINMRRSFEGLAKCTREILEQDPSSGALFIFASKRGNSIKVMWWDKTGYCILYKRLSRGFFKLPPSAAGAKSVMIDARELALILEGVEISRRRRELKIVPAQARAKALQMIVSAATDPGG